MGEDITGETYGQEADQKIRKMVLQGMAILAAWLGRCRACSFYGTVGAARCFAATANRGLISMVALSIVALIVAAVGVGVGVGVLWGSQGPFADCPPHGCHVNGKECDQ